MSKIEWTERTWNPIVSGCSIVSKGCSNCYAMAMASRLEAMGVKKYQGLTKKTEQGKIVWNGEINIDIKDEALYEPLKRKKPTMYFVNSMTDLFHPAVPFYVVDMIMAVIALCPQHTFQVLTKRPERMKKYFEDFSINDGQIKDIVYDFLEIDRTVRYSKEIKNHWFLDKSYDEDGKISDLNILYAGEDDILPNLWLGVSVENQKTADERIPYLLETPAAVRFLSCEPLLEYTYLLGLPKIDWVIVGGESGHNARPMQADWVQYIRNQCKATGTAFFFKQWGEYNEHGQKVGKKAAGRLLDGQLYEEMPTLKTSYTNE